MSNFNINKFKFRWQGSWTANTNFIKDDIVTYDGKAFVCLKSHLSSSLFFNDFDADYASETIEVTVGLDSISEKQQGNLYLNGTEASEFTLLKGRTYVFNQSDESNATFGPNPAPLIISNVEDGTRAGGAALTSGIRYFLDGVETDRDTYAENFLLAETRSLEFTVPLSTPERLFYHSALSDNMGASFDTRYSSLWQSMIEGYYWEGDWTTNKAYSAGSIVKFGAYLYQAIQGHISTNVETLGLPGDIDKWILFATTFNWLNEWNTANSYQLGDVVRYNGRAFICNERHISADTQEVGLEQDSEKWTLVSRSDNWRYEWTPQTRYIKDDLVKYGAVVYRCIEHHTSASDFEVGLESDISKWEIVLEGIEYRQDWAPFIRYRKNDVVKYGPTLWQTTTGHESGADFTANEDLWNVYVPGLSYETQWDQLQEYRRGEIVLYGGRVYTALQNNINSTPSANGKLQNTGDWELLTTGYNFRGDWDIVLDYRPGDVVRVSGFLYVAISDSIGIYPDSSDTDWQILIKSDNFKAEWQDGIEYFLGDVVTWQSTAYVCLERHNSTASDSRPDLDQELDAEDYWTVLIAGENSNVLEYEGDIKTFDGEATNLSIGISGNALKVGSENIQWQEFNAINNVYYVALDGEDSDFRGTSRSTAFRTIRFACNYILQDEDNRAPATIYITTGQFQEELPISVPANVALVGDELRSTVVTPAAGFEKSDMFRVRNGSGIRQMTLKGLKGELSSPNQYLTRRPDTGAFVALDPGFGPLDESVQITDKSCYVQNVSTFGEACIGMRVDGSLHGGGNKSIVANDFTQILSDGIGYWASSGGRSELVSVFTYYCHIGYLSTDGGIVRATNGNNSYGEFGSVAEGFSQSEIAKTALVDNRRNEAQFSEAVTFGTTIQQILAIGYSHAGQDYTTAEIEFGGAGTDAEGTYTEFRNNAISNVRILSVADSSVPGGINYTNRVNNAQSGNEQQIIIAQADSGTAEETIGQRIRIQSGRGVGQYAEITNFDPVSKVVTVSKESNGKNGWDHFQPGWPIEPELDETTTYSIEPLVNVTEPEFSTEGVITPDSSRGWFYIEYGDEWVALTKDENGTAFSQSADGISWTTPNNLTTVPAASLYYSDDYFLPYEASASADKTDILGKLTILETGFNFVELSLPAADFWQDIAGNGLDNFVVLGSNSLAYTIDNGQSFALGSGINFTDSQFTLAEFGNGRYVAIDIETGNVAVSNNTGATWQMYNNALPSFDWSDIVYGNGRFVAIAAPTDSSNDVVNVAISFDGVSWQTDIIEFGDYAFVSYGDGVFVATGPGNNIAKSQDGLNWRITQDDSTEYNIVDTGNWAHSAYNAGSWTVVEAGGFGWRNFSTGATAVIRARLTGSRIDEFIIYDPGSNYNEDPEITVFDNSADVDVVFDTFLNNGVLAQPEMVNRGTGYTTITAGINGDGFAEIQQVGTDLKVKNLSAIPGPGANVEISGIEDERFSVTTVPLQTSTPEGFEAILQITPPLDNFLSPDHETEIVIREEYSQIRLTGHDFLDIGTGNQITTNYPNLYVEGETSINEPKPFNETVAAGGGRVFYTSTDQDGNFRVGELFEVEQSTGIVTINASQFDLSGLTELALGGIQVGGTQVVVREFSRDPTFVANSNNIVSTQAAIKEYITKQVSGGGSNAQTNRLVAGQIQIDSFGITTTSGFPIQVKVPVVSTNGIDGVYLAQQFFAVAKGIRYN